MDVRENLGVLLIGDFIEFVTHIVIKFVTHI